MSVKGLFILFLSVSSVSISQSQAATPDWTEAVAIPPGGRPNPYQLPDTDFQQSQHDGKIHAQIYPVTVTGMLPPYEPIRRLIEDKSSNPLKQVLNNVFKKLAGIRDMNDFLKDLGLHDYPQVADQGVYAVPYPNSIRPDSPMGFGLIHSRQGTGFSFSCAACHSSNLFGKTVLGLTNRFPKANDFFVKAKFATQFLEPLFFQVYSGATQGETEMLSVMKENMRSVGVKSPIALGLDTSLAQVSLSLNHRNQDDYATTSGWYSRFPRRDILDHQPADSKPAVWWNLKYKNRWLSDGSVIAGNPIFTNLIWNEIGRGADLHELESWLQKNAKAIQDLTTAVFSSEAPRYTDFFPAEKIDLRLAQAGEKIFVQNCARCHGNYEKAWSQADAEALSPTDKLKTVQVYYRSQTPVVNVGTDPYRRLGMKSLEKLNDLAISKKNGIQIKAQEGYVPPPLVGIWSRWPYFHNNSAPSLCAVLTPQAQRPVAYYSGEALNRQTDFDSECNGYPVGSKTPAAWRTKSHLFDTRKMGLSNNGHDVGIFVKNGQEVLTAADKKALIQFLQTL